MSLHVGQRNYTRQPAGRWEFPLRSLPPTRAEDAGAGGLAPAARRGDGVNEIFHALASERPAYYEEYYPLVFAYA
jgi:hypothetical protein